MLKLARAFNKPPICGRTLRRWASTAPIEQETDGEEEGELESEVQEENLVQDSPFNPLRVKLVDKITENKRIFERDPALNSYQRQALRNFLVMPDLDVHMDENKSVPVEHNSLEAILSILDKSASVLLRKELDFFYSRSKLFKDASGTSISAIKGSKDKGFLKWFALSRFLLERESKPQVTLEALLKAISSNQWKNYTVQKLLAEFRDQQVLIQNSGYIKTLPTKSWLIIFGEFIRHLKQIDIPAMTGFTNLMNAALASNAEIIQVHTERKFDFTAVEAYLDRIADHFLLLTKDNNYVSSLVVDFGNILANLARIVRLLNIPKDQGTIYQNLNRCHSSFMKMLERKVEEARSLRLFETRDLINCLKAAVSFMPPQDSAPPAVNAIIEALESHDIEYLGVSLVDSLLNSVIEGGIQMTPLLGEKLEKNIQRLYMNDIIEVYVTIFAFKNSGIPVQNLMKRCIHALQNITGTINFETEKFSKLVMLIRCFQFFAEAHISRNDAYKLKFTLLYVLRSIENHPMMKTMDMNELLELASAFAKFLSVPDFLLNPINERLDGLELKTINKKIFKKFITTLLERLDVKYTYSVFDINDYDHNSKYSRNIIEVLRKIIMKLKTSASLSNQLLNLSIMSNYNLTMNLIPQLNLRKTYIESVLKSVLDFISSSPQSIPPESLKDILMVLSNHAHEVHAQSINSSLDRVLPLIAPLCMQSPQSPDNLTLLYYFAKTLQTLKPTDSTRATTKKVKGFFNKVMMPVVLTKCQSLLETVTYDKEVKQYFNPNIFLSDFAGTEYIPTILNGLSIPITPLIAEKLQPLFARTCKRWNGQLLVDNLNIMIKYSLSQPELFFNCIPNLFTLFDYYPKANKISVNPWLNLNDVQTAFEATLTNLLNYRETNRIDTSLLAISMLASQLFDNLKDEAIIKLLKLLESREFDYNPTLLKQIENRKFTSVKSREDVEELYLILPPFIHLKHHHLNIESLLDSPRFLKLVLHRQIAIPKIATFLKYLVDGKMQAENLNLLVSCLGKHIPSDTKDIDIIRIGEAILKLYPEEENIPIKESYLLAYLTYKNIHNKQRSVPEFLMHILNKIVRDVIQTPEYGSNKIITKGPDGRNVEITYFKSNSLENEEAEGAFAISFESIKLNPKLYRDDTKVMNKENNVNADKEIIEFNAKEIFEASSELRDIYSNKVNEIKLLKRLVIQENFSSMVTGIDAAEILKYRTSNVQKTLNKFNDLKRSKRSGFVGALELSFGHENVKVSIEVLDSESNLFMDIFLPAKNTCIVVLDFWNSVYSEQLKRRIPDNITELLAERMRRLSGLSVSFVDIDYWSNQDIMEQKRYIEGLFPSPVQQ